MKTAMRLAFVFILLGLLAAAGLTPRPALAGDDAWSKLGFHGKHIVTLTSDPARPATLYAVTSEGLMKSLDKGQSWSPLGESLPRDIPGSCFAVNPRNSKALYMGFDGHGLFASADGGLTWSPLNEGLPNKYVRCIAISPKDPNLMYVGVQGGVAISTNAGKNWNMSSGFKRAVNVNAVAIDPKNPQNMYAATGGAGVFKSGNSGVSWRDYNDGLSSLSIMSLHIDPDDPNIILAGAYHPATPTDLYVGDASGGVYRSLDGGKSWAGSSLVNITIFSFTSDPARPGLIYTGAWGGVYRSQDQGATWTDMNTGLDNAFLHAILLEPGSAPPVILAGTTWGLLTYTDNALKATPPPGKDRPAASYALWGGVIAALLTYVIRKHLRRKKAAKGGDNDPVW